MPQLVFPGNPIAIGIESALITYLVQSYGLSAGRAPLSTFALVAAASAGYNYYYGGPPSQPNVKGQLQMELGKPKPFDNTPPSGLNIPWTTLGLTPGMLAMQNSVFAIAVEYSSGSLALADILMAFGVTYIYNLYIQSVIAPYINDITSFF